MLEVYKSQSMLWIHLCYTSSRGEVEDKFASVALQLPERAQTVTKEKQRKREKMRDSDQGRATELLGVIL